MNKKMTRSNSHPDRSLISFKKTTLIIYLAIVLILIATCGVLYGRNMSLLDSNLQSTVTENQNENGNDESLTIEDELIPAGNVVVEDKQPTEDKQETEKVTEKDNEKEITKDTNPIEPVTPPVKETNKQPEVSKPDKVEKPTEKPTQEQKDNKNENTGGSIETVKLPTTYVVQKGDTLSSISEKFYRSKNYYSLLAEHNKILLINDMKAGDKLTIPALSSGTGSTGGKPQSTNDYSKITLPATYLIQSGDTLSSISKMFYKSVKYVEFIAKENKLDSNQGLKAGSNLIIPSLKNYNKPEVETDDSWGTSPGFESTDHTVKSGETLYSISQKYYNSTKYAMFIADYNQIVNIDNVKIGTVLKIPNK